MTHHPLGSFPKNLSKFLIQLSLLKQCFRALILRRMPRMPEGVSFEHILVLATPVAYGHWASLVSDSGTYGA